MKPIYLQKGSIPPWFSSHPTQVERARGQSYEGLGKTRISVSATICKALKHNKRSQMETQSKLDCAWQSGWSLVVVAMILILAQPTLAMTLFRGGVQRSLDKRRSWNEATIGPCRLLGCGGYPCRSHHHLIWLRVTEWKNRVLTLDEVLSLASPATNKWMQIDPCAYPHRSIDRVVRCS